MESIIFSVDGRTDLLDEVESSLFNVQRGNAEPKSFSDGEVCIDLLDSVRGKRVYLLASPNTSDKLMQLYLAIDAAKRAAAKEIIPIITYYPYARQDKKDNVRGPIGAKVVASTIEACGATQVITFDLHADQIQGFFNIPVTHLEGKYVFDRKIYEIIERYENIVFCAPDAGASKRVKHTRDQIKERWNIDLPIVMIDKTRPRANEIGEMVVIGDVKDKYVIIVDDMVDTAGTLCKAAERLLEGGAKGVTALASHGVLSGKAYENIYNSKLNGLYVSNSLPLNIEHPMYTTAIGSVSMANQIVKAILAINENKSLEHLKHEN